MELVNERLRKELEEELKLDTEQLCSHAWYHGCLPRKEAESMLQNDGEFLIRDSRSSLGDYVLSCQWGGQALHFKIIRVVLRPRKGYSRTLFQFEQEQFDNVPALVRFYVGNRKIISDISGAVVSRPVNRSVPLRCLEERFSDTGQSPGPPKEEEAPLRRFSFRSTIAGEQIGDGNLLRTKDRSGSDPSSLDQLGQRPSLHGAQSDSNLLTGSAEISPGDQDRTQPPPLSPAFRTGSDPVLRPSASAPHLLEGLGLSGSEGRLHSKAPPKPLRIPSMLMSDYCELIPKVPQGPRSHVERLRTEERWRGRAHITETAFGFLDSVQAPFPPPQSEEMEVEPGFERPLLETTSSFQLQHFNSLLLTPNNKPLDSGTLKHLKDIFATHDCHTTALHILKMDCQISRLEQTWRHLRQSHTASAIVFEKQLKPLLGNLNRAEGNSVFSPKEVAIPHILPLLSLMEGEQLWDDNETCDVLLRTLEAARFVATNSGAYRIRAEARLQGFQGTPELLEVFQTEFSLRLFWGSKGAQVERGERYKKFERILTVLSQKLE